MSKANESARSAIMNQRIFKAQSDPLQLLQEFTVKANNMVDTVKQKKSTTGFYSNTGAMYDTIEELQGMLHNLAMQAQVVIDQSK